MPFSHTYYSKFYKTLQLIAKSGAAAFNINQYSIHIRKNTNTKKLITGPSEWKTTLILCRSLRRHWCSACTKISQLDDLNL